MLLAVDVNCQLRTDWEASPDRAAAMTVRRVYELMGFLSQKGPLRTICAFDTPGPTFRHELFAGYKADRETPIECVSVEGFEADDILVIFSRDKDCFQLLVKDQVTILRSYKSDWGTRRPEYFTADSLQKRYGLEPTRFSKRADRTLQVGSQTAGS